MSLQCQVFWAFRGETARNDRTQWKCHWSVALVEFSIELFSKCNWVKGRWAQIHGILFFLFLQRLMGMKCFSHSMNLSHEDSASKTCKQHVDKDLDSISNAWNALWVCVGEEKKHIINNYQHQLISQLINKTYNLRGCLLGVCWRSLPGGGFLVSRSWTFSGPNVIYLYPDCRFFLYNSFHIT